MTGPTAMVSRRQPVSAATVAAALRLKLIHGGRGAFTLDDLVSNLGLIDTLDPSNLRRRYVEASMVAAALHARLLILTTNAHSPEPASEPERLLNAAEVAERLGLSTDSIYEMARRGTLPSVRHGKRVGFSSSALSAYIRQRSRAAPPP
jgi:excisionase family DNA binding protein